ncbi:MAG: hypothetical protein U0223_00935 [Nitrospira sp.]
MDVSPTFRYTGLSIMSTSHKRHDSEDGRSPDPIAKPVDPVTTLPAKIPEAQHKTRASLVVRAGGVYFLIALGVGFVLEVVRLEVIALHISELIARLLEVPNTLLAMIIGAKWTIDRFHLPPIPRIRLGIGFVAFVLMILMESTIVLPLHGLTIDQYMALQHAVVGVLPFGVLAVLTGMPLLVSYRWER